MILSPNRRLINLLSSPSAHASDPTSQEPHPDHTDHRAASEFYTAWRPLAVSADYANKWACPRNNLAASLPKLSAEPCVQASCIILAWHDMTFCSPSCVQRVSPSGLFVAVFFWLSKRQLTRKHTQAWRQSMRADQPRRHSPVSLLNCHCTVSILPLICADRRQVRS